MADWGLTALGGILGGLGGGAAGYTDQVQAARDRQLKEQQLAQVALENALRNRQFEQQVSQQGIENALRQKQFELAQQSEFTQRFVPVPTAGLPGDMSGYAAQTAEGRTAPPGMSYIPAQVVGAYQDAIKRATALAQAKQQGAVFASALTGPTQQTGLPPELTEPTQQGRVLPPELQALAEVFKSGVLENPSAYYTQIRGAQPVEQARVDEATGRTYTQLVNPYTREPIGSERMKALGPGDEMTAQINALRALPGFAAAIDRMGGGGAPTDVASAEGAPGPITAKIGSVSGKPTVELTMGSAGGFATREAAMAAAAQAPPTMQATVRQNAEGRGWSVEYAPQPQPTASMEYVKAVDAALAMKYGANWQANPHAVSERIDQLKPLILPPGAMVAGASQSGVVNPAVPAPGERGNLAQLDYISGAIGSLVDRAQTPEIQGMLGGLWTNPAGAIRRGAEQNLNIPTLSDEQRQFLSDKSIVLAEARKIMFGIRQTAPELASLAPALPADNDPGFVPKLAAWQTWADRNRESVNNIMTGSNLRVPPAPASSAPRTPAPSQGRRFQYDPASGQLVPK